ncbi:glycine/D-amino acid oxidase-like deaminating enzyme [Lipingzhangella halophila]|uniref:Glycine/D-amino acid oxidase-like deaminating enzyme n=1 Tax=Lipingzhangella halophila TaxID=1783352 RepID=A0A7W7RIF4_9ACTN|nr:FAD-binding oxidoreductase [Lipingzhangella halophila]MBB4932495.1 glycine/D-amino acid oxidase-like deaminating enzyme [Lipingzhangella halophila]
MRSVPRSAEFRNGGISFWFRELGCPERRAALLDTVDYDVCIVGGGYTGLWTAYYLQRADPGLRIALLESEFCGFGASGRNGGWLSAEFAGSRERYAQLHSKGAAIALQRALMNSVDEVIDTAGDEGIDADIVKGGMRLVATNPAQRSRLHAEVGYRQEWGFWPEDLHLLEHTDASRLHVDGTIAAAHSPHAARVQPAKLAVGLANVVEGLGVHLFEGSAVTEIRPGDGNARPAAVTEHGVVRADHVIRATEGYPVHPRGQGQEWQPARSSMIVTEPLTDDMWRHIGWEGREVLGDAAHAFVYAQRTADGRIAIGGSDAPFRTGPARDDNGATEPQTIAELWRGLARLFPIAAEVPIVHAWSGAVGVARDRCPSVDLDRDTGLGWAGGYAGSGVTAANLAGRTLRDLVLGHGTELTRLPWVGHQARAWRREPWRRIGPQLVNGLYRTADRRESRRVTRTSRFAGLAARMAGREPHEPGPGGNAPGSPDRPGAIGEASGAAGPE